MTVTRFAPSPTGSLHIGGARTAIFSWLLARSQSGRFLLRIEDTDRERSTQENTDLILESLTWLGLDWDADPVYQSQRDTAYNAAVDALLANGQAYWCECTPEEVEAMREEARAKGEKPKYNGRCRERGLEPGEGRVARLKTPLEGKTVYGDVVKGTLSVDNAELDDMVLRRPDGSATYNLAVVVDDLEMGVTHVLRGDDHVNNTFRQLVVYAALGAQPPQFGHVPLIHGQDKKKLSKRHGAKSVLEYREAGILPEALLNYLVRLGWSHGDQEIFTLDELRTLFSLDHLSSSPAAFDPDKLFWVNAQYIKDADDGRLAGLLQEQLQRRGHGQVELEYLIAIVSHYKQRAQTLAEMAEQSEFFIYSAEDLPYDEKASSKFLDSAETRERLAEIRGLLDNLASFDAESIDAVLKNYVEQHELKFKVLAQPLRVAVTGSTRSPGLGDTLEVLGRERVLARLDRVLE